MDKLKSFGELALGSRLKRLSDSLMKDVKSIYKRLYIDFEPTYLPVFRTIQEEKLISIGDIANSLNISQPAVTQFVNAMIKKELITASSDLLDRRKKLLRLSDKGKAIFNKLQPIWTVIDHEVKNISQLDNTTNLISGLEQIEKKLQFQSLYSRILNKLKSNISIVDFHKKYVSHFHDLNIEWLEKYFYVEEHDKEVLRNPQTYIIDNKGYIFFAKYNDEIVGTVALMNEEEGYELSKMAVSPKYQGLKIGQQLMSHCIEFSINKGWDEILLYSNTLLTPAINLYKKNEFIEVPIGPDSPYERSDIKMVLKFN